MSRQVESKDRETPCPLCSAPSEAFHRDRSREYMRCPVCSLVYVPPVHHPGAVEEKRRYDLHRNDPGDPGYRAFLGLLIDVVVPLLPEGAVGIDYGSGPGPTVSVMLGERGFDVVDYDPFYAPDAGALERGYDFLISTETVEHFHNPGAEWGRMISLVNGGGLAGVMTGLIKDDQDFSSWRYKDDPTHVCFYSVDTMRWIAGRYGLRVSFHGERAAVFRKGREASAGKGA
ncbi:MAG: class I SAM-dependent methyltransferase [Thermodesulfobacteriota bacterium]